MSVKVQFVKDGKTTEYILDGDVTISVEGDVPSGDASDSVTLQNASVTIEGAVPWSGVELEVVIPSLNVRDSTATRGEPAAKLMQGEKVTVSSTASVVGNLTWRQIHKPAELSGKWIAEKYKDDIYLAPVGTVQTQEKTQTGTSTGGQATTVNVTVDRGTDAPAPLTGRFQLVQRKGPHGTYTALSIDGDPTPKMGVNVRELAYFGTPQWKYTQEAWLGNYAAEAAAMGMKWVRFFAAHREYTDDQIVKRIRTVLDVLAKHNLIAVVCFADSLAEKGMFPKGDEPYHSGPSNHYIKDYFNNKNYRENYLPFVKRIVNEFKGHKGVGMWQLMNEMAIYSSPASVDDVKGFAGFVDEVSEVIYTMDSTHPISIGIINTAHIQQGGTNLKTFARDFYKKRKFIHAATSHVYQNMGNTNSQTAWDHEDNSVLDADAANESGRAMLWTEFGAANNADRLASTNRFLERNFVKGSASAALQWGFMLSLGGMSDTGIGDGNFGFSPGINNQYDQLKNLFVNAPKKA